MKDLRSFHSSLTPPQLASSDSVRDQENCGHLVQFYSKNEYLLDTLEVFVGGALMGGASAILIATAEHHQKLARRLGSVRIDLGYAAKQGRYFALGARQTLSSLMADGHLDRNLVHGILGKLVEKALRGSRNKRVVIFGEMVALLWSEGKHEDAMQLESFWNDIGRAVPFTLLCGYPLIGFDHVGEMGLFLQICAAHSAVIPEPSRDLKMRGTMEDQNASCTPESDSGELSAWLRDYEAALSETDGLRLFRRVEAAEAAILSRLKLLEPSVDSNAERQLLLNAAANLQIIKRNKLGFK